MQHPISKQLTDHGFIRRNSQHALYEYHISEFARLQVDLNELKRHECVASLVNQQGDVLVSRILVARPRYFISAFYEYLETVSNQV